MNSVKIRPAEPSDVEQILSLVNDVIRETYGHLFNDELLESSNPNQWTNSWVATEDGKVVGVALADSDYIDDLWLRPSHRGRKIGGTLLSNLESQIRKNGFFHAKLRVVAENEAARRFYRRQGWQELRTYPHEKWKFLMVDLRKDLTC